MGHFFWRQIYLLKQNITRFKNAKYLLNSIWTTKYEQQYLPVVRENLIVTEKLFQQFNEIGQQWRRTDMSDEQASKRIEIDKQRVTHDNSTLPYHDSTNVVTHYLWHTRGWRPFGTSDVHWKNLLITTILTTNSYYSHNTILGKNQGFFNKTTSCNHSGALLK